MSGTYWCLTQKFRFLDLTVIILTSLPPLKLSLVYRTPFFIDKVIMIHQHCSRRLLIESKIWNRRFARSFSSIPNWATADPETMGVSSEPYRVSNLVGGKWVKAKSEMLIPHPLDKDKHAIFSIPNTSEEELGPFFRSMKKVPKSGVHNPLKNPERYVQYGEISRQAGAALSQEDVAMYFAKLIMSCVPKSEGQALGEVKVTAAFLNNFAGDNVRRLAKSFGVPGDHYGQYSVGHRWPYGPVALITPFNFPLEIPVLQLMVSKIFLF